MRPTAPEIDAKDEKYFFAPLSPSLRERSPVRRAFIEVLRVASTRTFPRSRGLGSLRGFRLGFGLRRSSRARRVLVERQEWVVNRRHGCSRRESRSKSNVNDAFVARQPTRVRVSTRPRARLSGRQPVLAQFNEKDTPGTILCLC